MSRNLYAQLPNAEREEIAYIEGLTEEMDDRAFERFITIYRARRQDPNMTLILACIGFLGISGLHRFILGHIGLGILYLLTAGLCFIGTIVDIVNYKNLTFEFNRQKADEAKMDATRTF